MNVDVYILKLKSVEQIKKKKFMYWILFIAVALVSYIVQSNFKNKFEKYSRIPLDNNMTGADVALKMLHDNGIYDVRVISTPGALTDHYNPVNKTVNLMIIRNRTTKFSGSLTRLPYFFAYTYKNNR